MHKPGSEIRKWPHFAGGQPAGAGSWPYDDREIGRLVMDQLAELPDVRAELVIPLRLAVQENRYHVPEEKIAERMLRPCLVDNFN